MPRPGTALTLATILAAWTASVLPAQGPPSPTAGVQVASSGTHTLIRLADGRLYGHGRNGFAQTGVPTESLSADGSEAFIGQPTLVTGVPKVRQVAVASSDRSMLLGEDGLVYTWGRNEYSALGVPENDEPLRPRPLPVPGLTRIVRVHACSRSGVALHQDGIVWTWGRDSLALLGRGAEGAALDNDHVSASDARPAPVVKLTGVQEIACGRQHALALRDDGTVWSWGLNRRGQLGVGDTEPRGTATQVPGLSGVTVIGAVGDGSFARVGDGSWSMWGHFPPVMTSADDMTPHPTPQRPPDALARAVAVSDGISLFADGTVRTFGTNPFGSLGTGQGPDTVALRGVLVKSIRGAVAVWGGNNRMFALLDDGTLMAWGSIHADRDARVPERFWQLPVPCGFVGLVLADAMGLTCDA